MKKLVLMSALLSGLCTFSSCLRRQYHFVNIHKTWSEAQSYCREKYTDLATIHNMEDMNQLVKIADMNHTTSFNRTVWIGLYSNLSEWKWSLGDSKFDRAGEAEFSNWEAKQPDSYLNNEFCGDIKVSGEWNDDVCSKRLYFICNQGESLVYMNISLNWTEAQSYCRQHYTDLASVRNQTENRKIQDMIIPRGEPVWFGLYRDRWIWSDGSNSSFTYWNKTEPYNVNGYCIGLSSDSAGRWTNWKCNDALSFFCYSVVSEVHRQVVRVKLTREVNSGVDMEDPAVKEAILQQIKMKLRENGLTEDFLLRWRKQLDGKVFQKDGEL